MRSTTMMRAVKGPPADLNEDPAQAVRGPAASTTTRHDFDELFRRDGAGLYRTLYAFSGGRRDVAADATSEARLVHHCRTLLHRDPLNR